MKNDIIKNGIFRIYKERKYRNFKQCKDIDNYKYYKDLMNEKEFNICKKINNANIQRKYRTKDRILKWLFAIKNLKAYENYKIVFGTLTFNDSLLEIKKESRRKYVERFLKDNTEVYIANIDYGEINDREHYHFIAMIKQNIDYSKWKSIINFERLKINSKDIMKVKNYIMKLNNHSYKESGRNEKLIQDRNRYIERLIKNVYMKEYIDFKKIYA